MPDRSKGEPRLSVVILAGGESRRMGRDKASLPVDGSTLLEFLVGRLRPVADEVIVAGGRKPEAGDLRWVPDVLPGEGPLAGMLAGFRAARNRHAWVVACDLPGVVPALGDFMVAHLAGCEAVVPRIDSRPQGLCAVYASRLTERLAELLDAGERSVASLLDRSTVRYLEADALRTVDPELRSFHNLNTPEDYERWLRREPPDPADAQARRGRS